jgi:hypothetical protein
MSSYLSHRRKGFQGGVTVFDGFGNRSRSFDGSSDYISIPDINESTTNLSVALWLKTTDQDWVTTHLAHWRSLSNNRAWFIGPSRTAETNGKKLMVFITENGDGTNPVKRYYGTTDVSDGTWHHVAFTWDNGTLKLFVDGSEETTTKVLDHAMTAIHNSNGPITVGCTWVNNAPANFGSGGKADIRIYNSTLTATDISDIYNGKNITTNLAGHWLKDDDNVLDNAGSNNGTNYGSKYSYDNPSPPVEFGSASRDFTNDYVDLGNSADFSFSDGSQDEPFSISTWIKCDTNDKFRIISKDNGTNTSREWLLATDSVGQLTIYLIDSGIFRGRRYTTALPENEWLHVASTYDGVGGVNFRTGLKLYVNGVQVDNTDYQGSGADNYSAMTPSTNNIVFIGRYATTYCNGKIADMRIYDDELTSSEVADLYSGTEHTDNLIGHWLTDNDDVEDKAGTNDGTNYGPTYSYDNPPMDLIPSRQASRSFDGASDYVDLGDALDNVFAGTGKKFTITAWIKTTTLEDTDFLSKYNLTGQRSFLCRVLSDGNLGMVMSGDGNFGGNRWGRQTDTAPINANTWHHVAITYDHTATGDYLRMWVDGIEDTTLTDWNTNGTFTSIFDGTASLRISGIEGNTDSNWGGKMADVRIYDTDLTASQILDIYNGTTDRTNLIGQWLTNSQDVLDHAGTNDGTNNGSTYSTDSPS